MLAPSSEVRGKRKRDKRVSERQPGRDPGEGGGAGVVQPACTPGGRVRRTWGRRKALLLRRLGGRRAQLCSDQGRRHVTKEERRPNLLSFFFFFPQVEWFGRLSSNARRRQRRTGLRRACGCLRVRRGLPGVLLGGGAQIFRKTCCCPMSMCASERLISRLRNEVPGANLGLF